MAKTALIAGSTGLIGGHVLQLLLDDERYDAVVSLSRRSTKINHPKLKEVLTPFDKLDDFQPEICADDVFICLGSTLKKAGSKKAFERMDFTYPLQIARIALANGATQLSIISALGADSQSIFFYNRTKGNLEEAILDLKYETINILQPSLLLGERDETRIGENIAQGFYKALGWAFVGPVKKYKAIDSETVATAMHKIAQENKPGINIYTSEEIEEMGDI